MNFDDINEMVDQYGGLLYKFCCKLVHNKTDADDLYQETFVKLAEGFHKIDKNNNPKSYLFSIVIYIWKSNCRKYANIKDSLSFKDFGGVMLYERQCRR